MSTPLLVATPGGHLTQLLLLAPRFGIDVDEATWVSTQTAQSSALLAGKDVVWTPYGSPRNLQALAKHLNIARRTIKGRRTSMVVSTGANLAPPFLAIARAQGIPAHFIDSATRVTGPSMAGRLAAHIPGVHLYTQYPSWADKRWAHRGNVFEGFTSLPPATGVRASVRRALVTVGTARGFGFDRLLVAARQTLPPTCEVTWQIGDSTIADLPGRVIRQISSDEIGTLIAYSDIVISHAGTGSALSCLRAGRCPVIIPRTAAHGEHIDDHQHQIAAMLAERGLAVACTPDRLSSADLAEAASRRILISRSAEFKLAS